MRRASSPGRRARVAGAGERQDATVTEPFLDLVTASHWTYLVLFAFAALDSVLPAVPSETALITAGVLAGTGRLDLLLVIAAGALGAWLGDNTSYLLGREVGQPVRRRFFEGEKARSRLDWARDQLDKRGMYIVVVARFIPGGRTATTFTAGLVHYPWKTRFVPATIVAALVWAVYASLLGYIGGRVFVDQPFLALGVALGFAFGVVIAVEAVRKVRRTRAAT
jgi:membrane-associated protein